MRGWVCGALVLLAGCAHQAPQQAAPGGVDVSGIVCKPAEQPEQKVALEMVDTLMAKGRNYAALAQLESKPMSALDHWLRYGQLLAASGQLDDAEQVFQAMVNRCGDGRSEHGLGMVLLKKHEVLPAISHLEKARTLSPSAGQVRNDYGYALMLVGRYEEAAFELRTALELANGQGPVRQNLAVAYLLTDDQKGLKELQSQYGFTADEMAYAEKLSEQFGRASQ
ncbi:MAG: hypothetical protein MI745_02105 [Pseudomonadales bacterium]|nr:hypothetical protein [Pseudomonadales bacterium]